MRHFASPDFWARFDELPRNIRQMARANFALLKSNPRHPSLHFKKLGRYWSVRVGLGYRALVRDAEGGILWGWIDRGPQQAPVLRLLGWLGSHAEYNRIISS